MKILFVSRAYPPVTGGIENQNYALSQWLPKSVPVTTIANHGGKKMLPFFLPYATLRVLFLLPHYDTLLLGDGVLAITGYIAKIFYPKKVVVSVVHGLDLTYGKKLYKNFWVAIFMMKLDGFIAVSDETRKIALQKGIPEEKIAVIPNGVEPEAFQKDYSRKDLEALLGESIAGKKVLLTTGRLVKRKGAEWFIRNVLPKLPKNTLYVLAGKGPEEEAIRQALSETNLTDRVKLLGRVSNTDRDILYNTVDIFIQPNIHIEGDIEGFGIAVIEAASCRRPVIASRLEGLKDAIKDQENGILVEPENSAAFVSAITALLENTVACQLLGEKAYQYTQTNYHWRIIARLYIEALEVFSKRVNE